MGKKGKRADRLAARKALGSRFDAIVAQLQEELRGIDLFAPPPPSDVCAICLLPLSRLEWNFVYKPCCGNSICNGCDAESAHAALRQMETTNDAQQAAATGLVCPFCREPISWEPLSLLAGGAKALGGGRDFDTGRYVRQLEMRADKNDPKACYKLGTHYYNNKDQGDGNLKATQYHLRAVELGSAESCKYVANCYLGRGIMGSNTERMMFFMRAGRMARLHRFTEPDRQAGIPIGKP